MEKLSWFDCIVLGFCFRVGWELLGVAISAVEKALAARKGG